MPAELKYVLMPFVWRLELLRGLDLERIEIDVSSYAWMLDLPLWQYEGEWFAVTPRQVRDDRGRFHEQWARTQRADLRWPVHVTRRDGRLVIIDGVHRLLRATHEGVDRLPAFLLPMRSWQAIRACS